MKLHLPKLLLTAVLAAVAMAPAAWGGDTYTVTGDAAALDFTTGDTTSAGNGIFLRAGADAVEATITSVKIAAGADSNDAQLHITGDYSNTEFDLHELTIGSLIIGDGSQAAKKLYIGDSTANVTDKQNVTIESMQGSLKALEITTKGTLTLGAGLNEAKDNKVTFTVGADNGQGITASGELIVASNATLKFAGFDAINHVSSNNKITLNGGTWEANGTRQSLGSNFVLTLNSGIVQDSWTGADTANGSKYGVIDIAKSGIQIVSTGSSSIAGAVRLRNDDLVIDVQSGTLSIDTISRQSNNTNGNITKKGVGTLKITTMAANRANEAFYVGNTTLEDGGTIEYAIKSTGNYSGTISGNGNVAMSGSGSVTLAKVSNLDGNISVTDGSLTITALEADKTLGVSVTQGKTLNIGSVKVDVINHQLDVISSGGAAYFSDNAELSSTGNGFRVENTTYRLFDGYVWNGSVDGFTVGSADGDTTLSLSGAGSIYFVNTGEHSISDNTEYINQQATGGYYVAEAGTLNINDASILPKVRLESANSKLYYQDADGNNLLQFSGDMGSAGLDLSVTKATVNGTELTTVTTGDSSAENFTGDVTVLTGATLKLGHDKGLGKIYWHDNNRKITIQNGATYDVNGKESYYHVILEGGATLKNGGGDVTTSKMSLPYLELSGDATAEATSQILMQKAGSDGSTAARKLALNGHKLTKTGNGNFIVYSGITLEGGNGTIEVDAGSFQVDSTAGWSGKVNVIVDAGNFQNRKANATFDAVTVNDGHFRSDSDTTITSMTVGAAADEIFITNGTTTVTGAVTADATTGLKKTGGGTLVLNGTTGKLSGSKLIVNNGTVRIQGSNNGNAMIAGSIEVNKGGTLQIVGRDTLGYKEPGNTGHNNYKPTVSITAQGIENELATIQLAGEGSGDHQTLSTNLILKGHTEMSGGEFSSFGGNVTVSGTNNTIKSAFQHRKNITFNVAESGVLTMEGAITDFAGFDETLTKDGAGTMTISGTITSDRKWKVDAGRLELSGAVSKTSNGNGSTFTVAGGELSSTKSFTVKKLNANGGTITLNGGGAVSESITFERGTVNIGKDINVGTVDLAKGGDAAGILNVKNNTVLTASTLWLRSASTVNIAEGATIKPADYISITGTAAGTTLSTAHVDGAKYLVSGDDDAAGNATDFSIDKANVTIASAEEKTIENRFNQSSLLNDGGTAQTSTGKVIANNQANSFVDVKAITGNIELMNLVNGGVQNLEVAAGKSVVATGTDSAKATVSVSGQATFGAGATLSANLTLESNAELVSVGEGGIAIGGADSKSILTLGSNIGLGNELKAKLDHLTGDATLVLFTNVSDLTLNDAAVEAALLSARNSGTTSVTTADASAVFAGIAADKYTINLAQGQVFLSAMPVPEPTTSMLGLVGLVALTFRRRRASR